MEEGGEISSKPLTVEFGDGYKVLNDWIQHCYDDFSEGAVGIAVLSTLKDLSAIIAGGGDLIKQNFNQIMEGMWTLFTTYADTRVPTDLILIKDKLGDLYALLKGLDASFPSMPAQAAGAKRRFEIDDGFKTPSKTAKVVLPKIGNPVALSNKYDKLSNTETSNVNDHTNGATGTVPKEPRPEPFYVKTENQKKVADEIDALARCKVYKKVQDKLIKFFPSTVEIYRKIQQYLTEQKIEFFGMKLKNERPRKVLIKGIPTDYDIAEVKGELCTQGYNVHRVSQLKNFRTKLPMPIYLVDVFVNDQFKHIFEMRNLLGFFVKVEAYKFKGAKQCYNCQMYNHSSECCFLNPVCLRCAGEHNIKQCTVTDRAGVKCANCGENHTANFGGCIKNPKNMRNGRVQTFRNSQQGFKPKPVHKNSSFPSAVATNVADSIRPKAAPSEQVTTTANTANVSKFNVPIVKNVNIPKSYSSVASPSSNVNNVNNAINSCVDQNVLLNLILSNPENFDIVFDKLTKLCALLERLQKLIANKSVAELLTIFNSDSLIGMTSSGKKT